MLPREKQIFMQRVRALQKFVDKIQDGPAKVTNNILLLWQADKYPLLVKTSTAKTITSIDEHIKHLACWLAERPFLESSFWLSSAYAIWVGDDIRSKKSLYFTPPILANRLIDNLVSHGASLTENIWMDPACGGAAFLAPVAIRMIEALKKASFSSQKIVNQISKNLIGNDIDATLAELSKQFLRMALYEQLQKCKADPEFQISVGDGLVASKGIGKKLIVICNPPYRKMKADEVDHYRESYSDIIEGQPNIYGLFIKQCLDLINNGGVAGLLTPTSYLSGQYFSNLRTKLLGNANICQIDIVNDRLGIFIGVEQETALSIFRSKISEKISTTQTKVCVVSKSGDFKDVGECWLPNSGQAWPIPKQENDTVIISSAGTSPFRLKDYGYTARIGSYVDYRDERKTYTKEPNNQRMKAVFPLIWSSDITASNTFVHGRTSKQDKHHLFIEMGTPDHCSVIRSPCLALQRVTSPDQSRRLIAAPVNAGLIRRFGGVVGENHVIFLEQNSPDVPLTLEQFSAVLASESVDRLFRCISGAVNVSIFELEQLPLPNPKVLCQMLSEGHLIDSAVTGAFAKHVRQN